MIGSLLPRGIGQRANTIPLPDYLLENKNYQANKLTGLRTTLQKLFDQTHSVPATSHEDQNGRSRDEKVHDILENSGDRSRQGCNIASFECRHFDIS